MPAPDPNAAPADPGMDPMAGGDPSMMEGDPAMEGGDMGMEGGETEGGDDSTTGIINQLSDEDKEAVRNYAKSLLSRDEKQNDDMGGMEGPAPEMDAAATGMEGAAPAPGQEVMMEITKGRLKKVQHRLGEVFGDPDEAERNVGTQKRTAKKGGNKNTPFVSPIK